MNIPQGSFIRSLDAADTTEVSTQGDTSLSLCRDKEPLGHRLSSPFRIPRKWSLSLRLFIFLVLSTLAATSIVLVAAEKKVSVIEAVFDSAVEDIQWLGPHYKTVFCRTKNGGLYRSTDSGRTWTDATKLLKGVSTSPVKVESIFLHPNSRDVIVVQGKGHFHFISNDQGNSFRPLAHQGPIHGFIFHPKRVTWALMSRWTDACTRSSSLAAKATKEPCRHDLYVTRDSGASFNLLAAYVVQYSWGDPTRNEEDAVFFSQYHPSSKSDNIYEGQSRSAGWSKHIDFNYVPDPSSSIKRLVPQGNKFLISNGYIFVARLVNEQDQTVAFMVSTDGGKTFKEARLPVALQEKSYSILDTSQNSVVLHVNHGHAARDGVNVGNVYISDAEGLRYSLSLPQNIRSPSGDCEFDQIASVEGVYIANYRDDSSWKTDGQDNGQDYSYLKEYDNRDTGIQKQHRWPRKGKDEVAVKTVISFDKGGVWSYLAPPRVDSRGVEVSCADDYLAVNGSIRNPSENGSVPVSSKQFSAIDSSNTKEECWLHLHGITNYHRYAPFYYVDNAVGLIMGTGNVGPYLRYEEDQVNTYLSRDGGLTWAEVHKGAYIYEFGDHGGLIVMADDTKKTNQVVFSWNEGQSWYDFDLGDHSINVDNIVIEPNSSSIEFLLYGTRGTAGVLYHLDFETLGQPLCKGPWAADSVASDYQTWTPKDGRTGDDCILGRKVTFTRRKPTSECFNGRNFARPVERKNCTCTERDYECEFGFTRAINSLECVPEDPELTHEECTSSGIFFVNAYRKIPGDTCVGGWTPQKVPVMCPASSPFSKRARMAMLLFGTPFIVGLIGVASYSKDNPRVRSILSALGINNLAPSSAKYAILGNAARYVFNTDTEAKNADAPGFSGHRGGGPAGRPGFTPLGYHSHDISAQDDEDDLHDFVDDQRNQEDDDDAPPLLDFAAAPPAANGFYYPHNQPSNQTGSHDEDLFFMPPSTTEQSRYPNGEAAIDTDVQLLGGTYGGAPSSSRPQVPEANPIPRLNPPPSNNPTRSVERELEML